MLHHRFLPALFTFTSIFALTIGCAEMSEEEMGNEDKIIGGRKAKSPDWMASIHVDGRFQCGATLVHDRWVLTAAHCVEGIAPQQIEICVGETKLSQCDEESTVGISQYKMHPGYNPSELLQGDDIALIRLKRPLRGKNLSPLARKGDEPRTRQKVRALGWGVDGYTNDGRSLPNHLQQISLAFLDSEECAKFYPGLSDKLVCIKPKGQSGKAARRSVCNGDSGGPIHFNGLQIGVTSFGSVNQNFECVADRPNAYTRVSAYSQWIKNASGGQIKI